jgi:hypothetical protein
VNYYTSCAIPKTDHSRAKRSLARLKAKSDTSVYAHVSLRDGLRCRACGTYGGVDIHRHHLRGRRFTTVQDVCCVCDECHGLMHVRIGGKRLKLYGDAEQRSPWGVLNGLTAEWRTADGWRVESGR